MSPRAQAGAAAVLALASCLWSAAAAAEGGAASPPAPAQPAAAQPAQGTPPSDSQVQAAEDAGKPPPEEDKKITLPNVNVQGKRNVFNDNDKKLKELQESLPCTGCDAKPHTKKKLVKRALDAVGDRVLPTEAPDHSDRDANDKAQEFSQQNTCTAANVGGCVGDNVKP